VGSARVLAGHIGGTLLPGPRRGAAGPGSPGRGIAQEADLVSQKILSISAM
jgi:hypothetical protein